MNIATCPHCRNAYSQIAETCHFCEQTIPSGNLSKFNAVEPVKQSKNVITPIHALAVFSGIAGFVVTSNLQILLHVILMPFSIFIGYYGKQLLLGLFLFVIFLGSRLDKTIMFSNFQK